MGDGDAILAIRYTLTPDTYDELRCVQDLILESLETQSITRSVSYNDGLIVSFANCVHAYRAMRSLLGRWSDPHHATPEILSAKLNAAMHKGDIEKFTGYLHFDAMPDYQKPAWYAIRLMGVEFDDTLKLSEAAAVECSDALRQDDLVPSPLHRLGDIVYKISFQQLLPVGRCFVRLASPRDLALYLAQNPTELRNLHPRKFEEVIAEILQRFSYEIQLTKATRDDGIDIIAFSRSSLGIEEKYLVQCKRYSEQHKVGVSAVRDLLGVGSVESNTGLMIVTTSSFTSPAMELAGRENARWRLHLRDYENIKRWLYEYGSGRK